MGSLHSASGYTLALSLDGQWLLSRQQASKLLVQYSDTRLREKVLSVRRSRPNGTKPKITLVAKSVDGYWLILGYDDNTFTQWPLSQTGWLSNPATSFRFLGVSSNGRWALRETTRGRLQVQDLTTGAITGFRQNTEVGGVSGAVWNVAVANSGKFVILPVEKPAHLDAYLLKWDLVTNEVMPIFSAYGIDLVTLTTVALTADDKYCLIGLRSGVIEVYDLEGERKRWTLSKHPTEIVCIATSMIGGRAISGSVDGTLNFWDIPSQTAVTFALDRAITTCAFRSDKIVIAADSQSVHAFELISPIASLASERGLTAKMEEAFHPREEGVSHRILLSEERTEIEKITGNVSLLPSANITQEIADLRSLLVVLRDDPGIDRLRLLKKVWEKLKSIVILLKIRQQLDKVTVILNQVALPTQLAQWVRHPANFPYCFSGKVLAGCFVIMFIAALVAQLAAGVIRQWIVLDLIFPAEWVSAVIRTTGIFCVTALITSWLVGIVITPMMNQTRRLSLPSDSTRLPDSATASKSWKIMKRSPVILLMIPFFIFGFAVGGGIGVKTGLWLGATFSSWLQTHQYWLFVLLAITTTWLGNGLEWSIRVFLIKRGTPYWIEEHHNQESDAKLKPDIDLSQSDTMSGRDYFEEITQIVKNVEKVGSQVKLNEIRAIMRSKTPYAANLIYVAPVSVLMTIWGAKWGIGVLLWSLGWAASASNFFKRTQIAEYLTFFLVGTAFGLLTSIFFHGDSPVSIVFRAAFGAFLATIHPKGKSIGIGAFVGALVSIYLVINDSLDFVVRFSEQGIVVIGCLIFGFVGFTMMRTLALVFFAYAASYALNGIHAIIFKHSAQVFQQRGYTALSGIFLISLCALFGSGCGLFAGSLFWHS